MYQEGNNEMKCKLCGLEYSNIAGEGNNSSPFSICRDCFKDCDCAGLEKL